MITGPDVSSNQPHPIDWRQVKAAGHTFAIVKATEGSSYTNPFFAGDVKDAKAAGLIVWPYVWISPGDGTPQGRHAVEVIKPVFGFNSLVWLDYEQEGVAHSVLHAVRAVIEAAGFRTGTYTFPDYWDRVGDASCGDCASRPLWWADYNPGHNRPAPAPWAHVSLRQTHGTSYDVPGIGGLQDMSRAEVDLPSLLLGSAPTPAPTPVEDFNMAKRYLMSDGKTQVVADALGKRKLGDLAEVDFLIKNGMISAAPPEPLTTGSDADIYLRKIPWQTTP